jgi:hypothetical protein
LEIIEKPSPSGVQDGPFLVGRLGLSGRAGKLPKTRSKPAKLQSTQNQVTDSIDLISSPKPGERTERHLHVHRLIAKLTFLQQHCG